MKNKYLTQFMKVCDPETHEIIANAEHAFEDGEITRQQRNEIIMNCIKEETENSMFAKLPIDSSESPA